ncbi:MAG: hypothetical protein Ta2A_17840 [Treponemataceae bacterium]|nr:MAG: hypothetical protein Ta2A_17840 [Treponemataceae bacterium]
MIIVQLKGGLGNQLFQYAVARHLAEKNKSPLKLDLTRFSAKDVQSHVFYALHHFNICAGIAEKKEVAPFYASNIFEKIMKKIKKLSGIIKTKGVYEKKRLVFDPELLNTPDNIFLCGYWQTEKYFKDIEDIIRQELSLKETLTKKSEVLARQIKTAKNTVSLHIRRGDYVTLNLALCSLDYYRECISILLNKLGSLNIFVFSDDPAWAKENLPPPHTHN